MAVSLLDIGNYYKTTNSILVQRFLGACLNTAYDILNESAGTANHANRLAWATKVLSGTEAELDAKVIQMFRYALVANAQIQHNLDESTDNQIQNAVNAQIDILAP